MTPCSLSEAIHVGFQKNPNQTRGRIIAEDGSICALGAGLLGIGRLEEYVERAGAWSHKSAADYLVDAFPALDRTFGIQCPVCRERGTLISMVVHLNDQHRWLPEQIISFVQSEEERLGYVTLTERVPCEYQPVQCESACCV